MSKMIMVTFRTKSEKEEMINKARQMEKFAAEFVDCLENSEEEYGHEERYYHDDVDYRGRMHGNRYLYK